MRSPHHLLRDPRLVGAGIAAARVGIGVVATLDPHRLARPWVGGVAEAPQVQVLARALGGRDIALGLAAVASLNRPGARRMTIGLGALADGVDLAATVLAWKDLPRGGRLAVLATTAGAVGIGAWAATR